MDKAKVQELANDLMFSVNDDEIKDIINEFESLDKMISFFDSIDTNNVEEMIYPLDVETPLPSLLGSTKVTILFNLSLCFFNLSKHSFAFPLLARISII